MSEWMLCTFTSIMSMYNNVLVCFGFYVFVTLFHSFFWIFVNEFDLKAQYINEFNVLSEAIVHIHFLNKLRRL